MNRTTFLLITASLLFFAGCATRSGTGHSNNNIGIETENQSRREKSLLELTESGDAAGVEKLLKVDIDLNAADDSGRTALHAAAVSGDADIAAILLIRGAKIDPVDDLGRTPLLLAVQNGNAEVAELLAARQADITITDDSFLTNAMVFKTIKLGLQTFFITMGLSFGIIAPMLLFNTYSLKGNKLNKFIENRIIRRMKRKKNESR